MKKITLGCLFLLISIVLQAQTLPLDFEVPEDNAFNPFNGATATVVTDPTDATNQVLELTSNGVDFDGAAINLSTFVDLSNDATNTITFQFWTPDATERTHLLKFEGGGAPEPATQLYFTTNVSGWQTVSLDFGTNLSNNYPILVLFADAGPGNTATGTYYIDDIDGPNGEAIPQDPIPATAAPVPNVPDSEVYSIYNDTNNFSTVFPVEYEFGTLSGQPDLDPSDTENRALKFNFGVAGWGQGEGGPDDVSAYDFVSFDYWAGANLPNGFRFVLISDNGTVLEYNYEIGTNEPLVTEAWTRVQIPMSYFTDLGFTDTAFFQWKMSPFGDSVDNAGIVYVDNILMTVNPLNNASFSQAEFSVFPNPSGDVWNITSEEKVTSILIFDNIGRKVMEVKPTNDEVVIDATSLSSGIYFARLSNDANQTKTLKLIKK